jgi:hypothetical protein
VRLRLLRVQQLRREFLRVRLLQLVRLAKMPPVLRLRDVLLPDELLWDRLRLHVLRRDGLRLHILRRRASDDFRPAAGSTSDAAGPRGGPRRGPHAACAGRAGPRAAQCPQVIGGGNGPLAVFSARPG